MTRDPAGFKAAADLKERRTITLDPANAETIEQIAALNPKWNFSFIINQMVTAYGQRLLSFYQTQEGGEPAGEPPRPQVNRFEEPFSNPRAFEHDPHENEKGYGSQHVVRSHVVDFRD